MQSKLSIAHLKLIAKCTCLPLNLTHTHIPFLLKGVAKLTAVREGEKIHSISIRNGFESLVFVQNSLVHMYAACGHADSAHKMFDLMVDRDLVAWNSVINGFALNGMPSEALTLFREMGLEGVQPDGFTMVSLLSACAELGALALGRRAHVYILKIGLSVNLHVNNALLDLYAKCGSIRLLLFLVVIDAYFLCLLVLNIVKLCRKTSNFYLDH